MGHALQVIQQSRTIRVALRARFEDVPHVVICRNNQLAAYKFTLDLPFLELVDTLELANDIDAAQVDHNEVVVLAGDRLQTVSFIHNRWTPHFNAVVDGLKSDNQPRNNKSILALNTSRLLALIHRHASFVTVVDLWDYIQANEEDVPQDSGTLSRAFSIGSNIVELVCWLGRQDRVFAVLGRDYEFNYSLRYFSVDEDLSGLTMHPRKFDFREAPSLIFQAAGGIIVASDLALYFFPVGEATLGDNAGSPTFPVSRNKLQNVITLDLSGGGAPYRGSVFTAHTLIHDTEAPVKDAPEYEERHVLVTDKGDTLLVFLKTSQSAVMNTTHDFQVVPLAKTTIASDLVHLDANVFFAASRLSQSVVFRILKSKPFIDICGHMRSTPPVLDLDVSRKGNVDSLVVALGGFYSGELTSLSSEMFDTRSVATVTLSLVAITAELTKVSPYELHFKAAGFDQSKNYVFNYERQPRIIPGASEPLQKGIITATCADNTLVKVEGGTIFYKQHKLSVADLSDPCSLSILERKSYVDVLICLTSNVSYYLQCSHSGIKFLERQIEKQVGKITVALVAIENEKSPLIITVSSDGTVLQRLGLSGSNTSLLLSSKIPSVKGWLRVESYGTKNPTLALIDSNNVWMLIKDPFGRFVKPTLVYTSNKTISDCLIDGDEREGKLLIFRGTQEVEFLTYKTVTSDSLRAPKYHSENAVIKTINVGNSHLVTIELEITPGRSGMVRQTLLKHFDRRTFQLLSTSKFPPGAKLAAMCYLGSKYVPTLEKNSNVFVVAENDSRMLLSYAATSDELICFDRTSYDDLAKVNTGSRRLNTVNLLFFQDGVLTLVGERVLQAYLEEEEDDFSWTPHASFPRTPFAVGYGELEGNTYIADSIVGVLKLSKDRKLLPCCTTPFDPTFVTAFATAQKHRLVVYGDSIGNLAYFRVTPKLGEELIGAVNIGDQINVIKVIDGLLPAIYVGTATGAIYSLLIFGGVDKPQNLKNIPGILPEQPWKPKITERPVPVISNESHGPSSNEDSPMSDDDIDHIETTREKRQKEKSKKILQAQKDLIKCDKYLHALRWSEVWTHEVLP